MKKTKVILPLVCLTLLTGCDVSWQAVSAAVAVASRQPVLAVLALSDLDNNDDESWWDNNDEHFDWAWWPFN